jgi:protein-L-isoaspartate(D-aspartate) O-methyltransferase
MNHLHDIGALQTRRVIDALSTVPREAFVPDERCSDAYVDAAVAIKWNENGVPISSLSQPQIVATMLELLDVHPGHRVLEIGTGSGYNAALLNVLVGTNGEVMSVEIEADLAKNAESALAAIGCSGVRIEVADGYYGQPGRAPYDRIIVTTGAPDIAPAWVEQLVEGGRLVLPVVDQDSGVGSMIAFAKIDGALVKLAESPCGFLPMRRP